MTRTAHYNNIYRTLMRQKIESLPGQVFARSDLTQNLSNKEQLRLNRALNAFMEEGIIIKISHGLYAKAKTIVFSNGKRKTVLREPFESVVIEALNKLSVKWELGHAILEYNRGETTQMPVKFTIQLKSRFRGSLRAEGRSVVFEDGTNAR